MKNLIGHFEIQEGMADCRPAAGSDKVHIIYKIYQQNGYVNPHLPETGDLPGPDGTARFFRRPSAAGRVGR
ncbi:hypothetical protein [Labrys monachus]|uniref:Uncharacterized protein n=1 Tax=Labrys monachus TaxID=217067 RepID=A0ABU0FBW6_9HYPH|nr:hypothetical protein [Labrys monachus]MDQ0392112.1 hypothetical protein [Labrys monachus]